MTISKQPAFDTSESEVPTSESFDFDLWAAKVKRQLVAALNHQLTTPELSKNDSQKTLSN